MASKSLVCARCEGPVAPHPQVGFVCTGCGREATTCLCASVGVVFNEGDAIPKLGTRERPWGERGGVIDDE